MIDAMMIDADVHIPLGDICAHDAGGQGLKETGTSFVPSISADVFARGVLGCARHSFVRVRP